ncbi:hypothetical protein H0H92_003202 [Tricholoma furcatifolium]|nr:hypothetical protein H0H92_003202 [Tricholoma furcatifolium]
MSLGMQTDNLTLAYASLESFTKVFGNCFFIESTAVQARDFPSSNPVSVSHTIFSLFSWHTTPSSDRYDSTMVSIIWTRLVSNPFLPNRRRPHTPPQAHFVSSQPETSKQRSALAIVDEEIEQTLARPRPNGTSKPKKPKTAPIPKDDETPEGDKGALRRKKAPVSNLERDADDAPPRPRKKRARPVDVDEEEPEPPPPLHQSAPSTKYQVQKKKPPIDSEPQEEAAPLKDVEDGPAVAPSSKKRARGPDGDAVKTKRAQTIKSSSTSSADEHVAAVTEALEPKAKGKKGRQGYPSTKAPKTPNSVFRPRKIAMKRLNERLPIVENDEPDPIDFLH